MNYSEIDIIKALTDGSKPAYTQIYRLYFYRVYAFINKYLSNEYLSKDISQEVFFRLWVNHSKLDPNIPIGSYLYAIAKNIINDYFKHKDVERRYEDKFLKEYKIADDEQYSAFNEINELIERAISTMPTQQAHVFRLSRFQGMLNEEIARELKISKRTVEKHISNSIKIMRKTLEHVLSVVFVF
ncbi:MAG: RNA polymerase sigma-70 factor [Rikenellaceae bacterium]